MADEKPRNPAEEQAETDRLASRLTGTDDVENLMAATEARRLEQRFGLRPPGGLGSVTRPDSPNPDTV